MIKVDLVANFSLGTLQVNESEFVESKNSIHRYTFNEVTLADSTSYVIP